jgi:hypothetical protein
MLPDVPLNFPALGQLSAQAAATLGFWLSNHLPEACCTQENAMPVTGLNHYLIRANDPECIFRDAHSPAGHLSLWPVMADRRHVGYRP